MRERTALRRTAMASQSKRGPSTARSRAPKSGAKKKRGRSGRHDTWWVWVRVEIEDAAPSAPLGVKRDGATQERKKKKEVAGGTPALQIRARGVSCAAN